MFAPPAINAIDFRRRAWPDSSEPAMHNLRRLAVHGNNNSAQMAVVKFATPSPRRLADDNRITHCKLTVGTLFQAVVTGQLPCPGDFVFCRGDGAFHLGDAGLESHGCGRRGTAPAATRGLTWEGFLAFFPLYPLFWPTPPGRERGLSCRRMTAGWLCAAGACRGARYASRLTSSGLPQASQAKVLDPVPQCGGADLDAGLLTHHLPQPLQGDLRLSSKCRLKHPHRAWRHLARSTAAVAQRGDVAQGTTLAQELFHPADAHAKASSDLRLRAFAGVNGRHDLSAKFHGVDHRCSGDTLLKKVMPTSNNRYVFVKEALVAK